MSFSYANPGSGPSAGGIGWFNFGNLAIMPGQTVTGLTGTLNDGTTVTFDLTAANISGASRDFDATTVPTYGGTPFGNDAYTGILGNTALYSTFAFAPGSNGVTLSNIVVKDSMGNPVPNYTAIVADAESTNIGEIWSWNTNGGVWNLFTSVGTVNAPTLAGLGTQNATITGINTGGSPVDYLLSTQSPTQLVLNTTTNNNNGGRQAISVGFAVTTVQVCKSIGDRIDGADQFVVNIAGTPNDQITTTGSANGIQSPCAQVYGFAGNAYTINEQMAPGSGSPLSAYTQTISAINLTPGGSMPPTGSLPITFTPALGDIVQYTILNSAPEMFVKPGDILTYTFTGINPNNFPLPGVVFTDPTPTGTSYIGNLIVNVPYTGTTPATGLTLTMPANSTVTASYQVQVSPDMPVSNPIVNIASAVVPGGTSGSTNPVTTQINYADLTTTGNIIKSVTPAFAQFGDTLTYTVTVKNTGNTAANNVVVTDVIPAGTTYVPGSITASVPFTGDPTTTISLTNPIPAGGTVTISFKVELGSGTPPVNPITNTATVKYAYTVDPANPNSVTGSGSSNTVATPVTTAHLSLTKSADKSIAYIGDIISYQAAVKNTGNVPADHVVLTDILPTGVSYVAGTLAVSVPYSGTLTSGLALTNPINAGQTVTLTFNARVDAMPNPNPIDNEVIAVYDYTVNPNNPNGVTATAVSNTVRTVVFRYNFGQQISDLIDSVALEQAALAAIAQAEGAKIQKMAAMNDVTTQELLCLNKSVSDMMASIAMLETVLKQKLTIVDCQINGGCI